MKAWINNLQQDFWGTLDAWQKQRPIWLLGGGLALGLEIFSWAYFQNYLRLNPCEMCVYIRFSMVVVFLGAALAALKPSQPLLRAGGYTICFWGLIMGLRWNIALELDYLKALDNPLSILCAPASAQFPLGLPLDQWLPAHFAPTAMCGEDGWSLWGWNMAEWLFLVYGAFILGLGLLLLSRLVIAVRQSKSRPNN